MTLSRGEQGAFTEAMITLAAQDDRVRALSQYLLTGRQDTLSDDVFVADQDSIGSAIAAYYNLEDYKDVLRAFYLGRRFVSREGYAKGYGWAAEE